MLGIDERTAASVGRDLAAIATPHVDRDRQYGGWALTVAPRTQSKWDGVAAFCALRDLEGKWASRSITRAELDEWWGSYEAPSAEELATYDRPT